MIVAVIPALDEAATIGGIVARLRRKVGVIVVDDASTDGTADHARLAGAIHVVRHCRQRGKAAALRTGFAEALRHGATGVVTLDGDGQHDPDDLPRLVEAARRQPDALVVGDRLGSVEGDRVPPLRLAGLYAADWSVGRLVRRSVPDSQCGYRLYPAAMLRDLALRSEGFVFETAVLLQAARAGRPIIWVPVRRIYLRGRRSRFRALIDGGRIAAFLGREAVSQLRSRHVAFRTSPPAPAPPPILEV